MRRAAEFVAGVVQVGVLVVAGCGPTGQARVERQVACDASGAECHAVDVARYEPTATDRFWQVFLALLLR